MQNRSPKFDRCLMDFDLQIGGQIHSESLKNPYMIDIIEKSLEWLSGDKFVKN